MTLAAGWLLDRKEIPGAWRGLYAVAALAAVYAYVQWARLKQRRPPPLPEGTVQHPSPWQALPGDNWCDRLAEV